MIKTVKKETCKKAQLLLETINKRKELEKLEKTLKDDFKTLLGSEVAINADGVLITLTERERTNLDKKALAQVVDLSDFETTSTYNIMSVRKVS